MKVTFKLLLCLAMAFSSVALIGCTGPTAVENSEEDTLGGETEDSYQKAYDEQMQKDAQERGPDGQGGYPSQ